GHVKRAIENVEGDHSLGAVSVAEGGEPVEVIIIEPVGGGAIRIGGHPAQGVEGVINGVAVRITFLLAVALVIVGKGDVLIAWRAGSRPAPCRCRRYRWPRTRPSSRWNCWWR